MNSRCFLEKMTPLTRLSKGRILRELCSLNGLKQTKDIKKDETQHICNSHKSTLLKKQKTLDDIDNMAKVDRNLVESLQNKLILSEMNYNSNSSAEEFNKLYNGLNQDQLNAFNAIIKSVDDKQGLTFFIYDHGGTGKTYLWQTIISRIRSERKIALAVAYLGMAILKKNISDGTNIKKNIYIIE